MKKEQDELKSKSQEKKVQCLICKRWYILVRFRCCSTARYLLREYREDYELEVKRGIVPKWYRELKGQQALENGTVENLKKGKKYWFKKGQEGLGKYKRSPITLERLKNNKLKKRK